MNKRGVSTIIVTVILVAIVLIALGVIWAVISNLIIKSKEDAALERLTVDADIKGVRINATENNISLLVRRNPGEGNLIGFNFLFKTSTEAELKTIYTDPNNMIELEERVFIFHLKINASDVINVKIVPIISVGEKEIFGVGETYIVKPGTFLPSSGGSVSVCGNNIAEPGEQCDGTDLREENCFSQGFLQGNLTCDVNCTFNTTECMGDTLAPIRSNGLPVGILPNGTTQTNISLTTNEPATCRYSMVYGTSYTSMVDTFVGAGGISHSSIILGLSDGGSYTYYVKCNDSSGNINTDDYPISFSIASPEDEIILNPPRTCSEVWGFDCGATCDIELDNTYDSCSNCGDTDERIDEIWINTTSVSGLEQIEVVCQYFTSETTADEIYVYYRNSTLEPWQQKCSGTSFGVGNTIRNWTSCDFSVDNIVGEHQVRCIIHYSGKGESCATGEWFDQDDVSFLVVSLGTFP